MVEIGRGTYGGRRAITPGTGGISLDKGHHLCKEAGRGIALMRYGQTYK